MLKSALAVVDAARQLQLTEKDGKTVPGIEGFALEGALNELRQAIEAFDAQGLRDDLLPEPHPHHRPDFALPPQLNDEGFELTPENTPAPDFSDEYVAEALEEEQDLATEKALALATGAKSAKPGRPAPSNSPYNDPRPHLKIGEGEFFAVEASDDEILGAIEVLSDKLGYAVKKVGWTPRLRKLAMAARKALEKVAPVGKRYESKYMIMPRAEFIELMHSMTEAAIDMDVKLPAPKPTLKKDKEEDLDRTPAPRF